MRWNGTFLQGRIICLWIIWLPWGCQTHWERKGWGSRRWGKLPVLSGLSSCLKEGLMTGRSTGEKKHTASCRNGGISEEHWWKEKIHQILIVFFQPLPLLSPLSVFFQSCWAPPRNSTSTTKTQMGKRSVCMCLCVCWSVRYAWIWVKRMQWKSHCVLIDMQIKTMPYLWLPAVCLQSSPWLITKSHTCSVPFRGIILPSETEFV